MRQPSRAIFSTPRLYSPAVRYTFTQVGSAPSPSAVTLDPVAVFLFSMRSAGGNIRPTSALLTFNVPPIRNPCPRGENRHQTRLSTAPNGVPNLADDVYLQVSENVVVVGNHIRRIDYAIRRARRARRR
jgi:hypothetical protein